MKAVILLNGEPFQGDIDLDDAYVICCDGAYLWAKGKVNIDENLGDFDSLSETPVPAPLQKFPSEKNETDGELAVDRAIALCAKEIILYGGGGKREDHFLGNLHLLYKAQQAGIDAVMVLNGAKISLFGEGEKKLFCRRGQTLSLLPFGGGAHIMMMRGLKYAEGDLWLRYGSTRGISNVAVAEEVRFTVAEGSVLCIINEEVV